LSGKYDVFMVPGQRNEHTYKGEGIPMSLCFSGLDISCCVQPVTIDISPTHPLIQLVHVIPWQALMTMVLPDLQRTTAEGKWWLGRKLRLRIHLGAFLLQWLYNLTDRQVDWAIRTMLPTNSSVGAVLSIPGARPTTPRLKSFAHASRPRRSGKSPIRSPGGPRSSALRTPRRGTEIPPSKKPISPIPLMRS
jgi:hypothetical protein